MYHNEGIMQHLKINTYHIFRFHEGIMQLLRVNTLHISHVELSRNHYATL